MGENPALGHNDAIGRHERREALTQAEGDVTHRFDVQSNPAELKARILDRMRQYFGI